MENFKTFVEQIKSSNKLTFISSTSSTDKTASLLLKDSYLKGDECEVLFYMTTLDDNTVVHTTLVYSEEYGYGTYPSNGGLLGKRVGKMHLTNVLSLLPQAHTEKQIARNYLAKNPDRLVSLLSNTLKTQSDIISEQDGVIQDAEWYIKCMFGEASIKMKKAMKFSLPMLMRVKGYWTGVKEEFNRK